MSEPEIILPNRLYDELMTRTWNQAQLNGQTFALICPLCGGFVATGAPPNGITFQDAHARYHRDVVTRVARLEEKR